MSMIVWIAFWYRKHFPASQAMDMELAAPITLTDAMLEGDQLGSFIRERP